MVRDIENLLVSTQQVMLRFQLKGKRARVDWQADVLGETNTIFKPPYAFDKAVLPVVIKALDAIQYPEHPLKGPNFNSVEQDILSSLGFWVNGRVISTISKKVGKAIYNGLDTAGVAALKMVRNYADAQGINTRYILRFPREAVNLAALPWELIRDDDQSLLFDGGASNSLERYLDIDKALCNPKPKGQKPYLLALLPKYKISSEVSNIEKDARRRIWQQLKDEDKIDFDEISPLTRKELNKHLRKLRPRTPDIIHYFGHGTFQDNKGYLIFDDDDSRMVNSDELRIMFKNVPIIFIQACQSSMINEVGGLLTGVAPILSIGNSAVVAMQISVRTVAAARFTEIFYEDLLENGYSLQEAVTEGRRILFSEYGELTNWYVPTLYIRSRDQGPIYLTE